LPPWLALASRTALLRRRAWHLPPWLALAHALAPLATQAPIYASGEGSEAFKVAEQRRNEAQRLKEAGQKPREETGEEMMIRLGLKTYVQAEAAGFDECATWRGCR
jgi:hypothetical protein